MIGMTIRVITNPAAIGTLLAAGFISLVALCASPAHADDLQPICSDRPGRGTGACTVETGHWQVELGLWDTTFQRRAGITTDVTSAADPAIKYGVNDAVDVEASIAFYQALRIHGAGSSQTFSSIGDLFLHAKWNPSHASGDAAFSLIFDPFVKLPTASAGLGNGAAEGGLLIPISWEIGDGWSLQSTPEADVMLNEVGIGYHANLVDVIGLSRDLEGGFNLGGEIWTDQNIDPAGTMSQYSAGLTLAWQSDPDNQIDGGFAIGLNRQTPDLELYVGISRRF